MKVQGLVWSYSSDDLEEILFSYKPTHRSFSFFSRRRRRRMRGEKESPKQELKYSLFVFKVIRFL